MDEQGIRPTNFRGHLPGNGQTLAAEGDEVGQYVLGGLCQRVQHPPHSRSRLPNIKAHQRHAGRSHQTGDHRDHNREQDLRSAGGDIAFS